MKKTNFRKATSLFLAVLMVLSCWVWVAPTADAVIISYPRLNNNYYTSGNTAAYGTPIYSDSYSDSTDNSVNRWFKFINGDDWTTIYYPTNIYLDVSETLQSAGYYFNVKWHFGSNTDYRILLGAPVWGDHSQWTDKPTGYYTMNNIFSDYAVDASLPKGYPSGLYGTTSSSTDFDLRIVGYNYSSQGTDKFTVNSVTHNKYVLFRSNQSTNEATIFLKGTPNASYKGTTTSYSTSGASMGSYGYAQNYSSGWKTHDNGTAQFTDKDNNSQSSYLEGQWKEMQWNVTIYDKSTLNGTVNEATDILNNQKAKYTYASLNNLQTVLNNNKGVLTTRETTQTNIDTANNNIRSAINALQVRTYEITYENLFSLSDWANSASSVMNNGTLSFDIANGTITTTHNGAASPTYCYTAHSGSGIYYIPLTASDEDRTFVFECNANVTSTNGNGGGYVMIFDTNDARNGFDKDLYAPSNLKGDVKATFTVPAGCDAIHIRFGTAGESGAKAVFSNIAIYEQSRGNEIGIDGWTTRPYRTVYNYGTVFTTASLTTPVRPGYQFDGWYLEPTYATPFSNYSNAYSFSASFPAYSKWTALPQTLSVDTNGGLNSGNLIYNPQGLSSFSGGSTSSISYNGTIDEYGVDISGEYTTKTSSVEATVQLPLWVYLEEGKTYEFSYLSSNNFTEFYLFPDGVPGNHASIKKNNGNNNYGEQFVCGEAVHQGESAWTSVADATGLYQIRLDQDYGVVTTETSGNKYNIQNFIIREVSPDATSKYVQPTGTTYTIPAPTKDGYTFNGWTVDGTTTAAGDYEYTFAAGGDTIVANWVENSYNIAFDANGGEGSMSAINGVKYDDAQTLTSNAFTKTGYKFLGWSEDKNATTATYTDGQSVSKLSAENGATVTLYAVWAPVTYKVVFNGNGATSGTTGGLTVTYDRTFSLTPNGFKKDNYHFLGWSEDKNATTATYTDGATISTNLTATDGATINLYAVWAIDTYKIVWTDEDGTVLETDDAVAHGTLPTYDGEEPTKASTAQYSYTFAGWTPEVVEATGNKTYKATYTPSIRKYTVKWLDDDGTVLEEDTNLDYGTVISFDGAQPTKASTEEFSYEFTGWEGYTEGAIVKDDVTFTATYKATTRTYTVVWENWNGTVLETDNNVPYGTMAEYNGTTPGRAMDAQYRYTFAGWDKTVATVTGDIVYTATYNTALRDYEITFINADGEEESAYYYYGTQAEDIVLPANTAAKADDAGHYSYAWPAVSEVTGAATYTEVETLTPHDYSGAIRNDGNAEDGTHSYQCTLGCGKYGNATPHTWNDGEVTTANDCGNDGVMTYTCEAADCGATYTETIAATGKHTYTDEYFCDTDATHQLVCDVCGHKDDATDCDFTDAYDKKSPEDSDKHIAYCVCGNTTDADHNWTNWVGDGNATDNSGKMSSYCADCGQTRTTECTYELTASKDANCTEDGYKTYECTDANCQNGYTVIEKSSDHSWDEGTVTTEPTCSAEGVMTFTCKHDSNHTRTEAIAIDAAAHDWDEGVVTTDPTCSEVGVKTFTCKHDANHTRTEDVAIDIDAHDWDEGTVTTEPTCSKEGVKVFSCKHNAAHTKAQAVAINADAHDWDEGVVTTDPTCSEVGVKTFTCKHDANHTKTEEVAIDADAHDWDEGVVTTDPTCSEVGVKTFTCKHDASHTRTEDVAIDADAHDWDEGTITTEATCVSTGVKTFTCNHDASHTRTEEVAIDADAHDWDNGTITKLSNCTEEGERTYYCKHNATHTKVEIIATVADAHAWDSGKITTEPTCSEEGVKTFTCKHNAEHTKTQAVAIDTTAHEWDEGTVTLEGTCSKSGEVTYICKHDSTHTRVEYTGIIGDAHDYDETKSEDNLTRPAPLANGGWSQGYYTFVCGHNEAHKTREYVDRADYTEYDKVKEELEGLLDSEYITDEIRNDIEDVLDNLAQNLIVGEESAITEATAELEEVKAEAEEKLQILENCANGNHEYPVDSEGNIVYDEVVEATCTEDGYYIYSCIHCGLEGKETLASTGHDWIVTEDTDADGWAITTAATCYEDGEKTRTCQNGCTETEVVPATNHEGSWVVMPGKAPTCIEGGYTDYIVCEKCGLEAGKDKLPATGHTDEDKDGKCDGCGRNYSDKQGECGCICHKDNLLMRLVYKIIRFFWKLFGIGKSCDCGTTHY